MLGIGIVGLPNVGKSTLFNALTRARVEAANYPFATIEKNIGVVPVPDPRLAALRPLFGKGDRLPALVPTTVELVDIAGLVRGASKGEGLGNQFLAHIPRGRGRGACGPLLRGSERRSCRRQNRPDRRY